MRYADSMTLYPLDLDLLRTFVAVVESGNFSSAAPRVGRSQSAVSMQMQRLEQELGRPLLTRMPRTVVPNAAGDDLLIYARRLLKLSDEARASVSRPDEAGTVRLGVPDDYAAFLLPPVLARFAEDYPRVNVELVCEPSRLLVPAIDEGRIDCDTSPGAILRGVAAGAVRMGRGGESCGVVAGPVAGGPVRTGMRGANERDRCA